ncbi:MAG TPA: beta-ketoacyl synthase N-terminal-like domain-containing protein, partial [Vicinamibacterales bacterium]|nr:beta-ketoacyl synthase N-terminal-like domain-containing protein [Vicinamibacterales bacterium]
MTRRRVAVTGIGLITALGSDRERTWQALVAGQCGMRPVTAFATAGYRSQIAAEVCMPAVDAALTPLQRRRWSRGDRIGAVAAMDAVRDAGLSDAPYDRRRVGVLLGAGTADLIR